VNTLWREKQLHDYFNSIRLPQEVFMSKDSQPDNKKARMEKCNGQTPITRENQNKNKNAKRKSIEHNDV